MGLMAGEAEDLVSLSDEYCRTVFRGTTRNEWDPGDRKSVSCPVRPVSWVGVGTCPVQGEIHPLLTVGPRMPVEWRSIPRVLAVGRRGECPVTPTKRVTRAEVGYFPPGVVPRGRRAVADVILVVFVDPRRIGECDSLWLIRRARMRAPLDVPVRGVSVWVMTINAPKTPRGRRPSAEHLVAPEAVTIVITRRQIVPLIGHCPGILGEEAGSPVIAEPIRVSLQDIRDAKDSIVAGQAELCRGGPPQEPTSGAAGKRRDSLARRPPVLVLLAVVHGVAVRAKQCSPVVIRHRDARRSALPDRWHDRRRHDRGGYNKAALGHYPSQEGYPATHPNPSIA